MAVILGIDPGKATGYAVYDTETQLPIHLSTEIHPNEEVCVAYYRLLCAKYKPDEVIMESFIPRFGQKFDLDGVYFIGAIRSVGRAVRMVSPSAHKAMVKDAPMNKMFKATKTPIGAGHSRDSLRLTVYWAATKLKHRETIQLLQGQGEK